MTKLKNTKKGMAKKALSISLVAAMLATSNVPVWAAEDIFSDGNDVAVEYQEPAADFSDAEADFNDTDAAADIVEEADAGTALTADVVDSKDYNFDNLQVADDKMNFSWADVTDVKDLFKSGSTIKDAYGNDADVSNLRYAYRYNGTWDDTGVDAQFLDNVDLSNATFTPPAFKANAGSSFEVLIVERNDRGDDWNILKSVSFGTIQKVDLNDTGLALTAGAAIYNGTEQKVAPTAISNQGLNTKYAPDLSRLTITDFDWTFSATNGYVNAGSRVTATGTLKTAIDGYSNTITAPAYIIQRKALADSDVVVRVKTPSKEFMFENNTTTTVANAEVDVYLKDFSKTDAVASNVSLNEFVKKVTLDTTGPLEDKALSVTFDQEKLKNAANLKENAAGAVTVNSVNQKETATTVANAKVKVVALNLSACDVTLKSPVKADSNNTNIATEADVVISKDGKVLENLVKGRDYTISIVPGTYTTPNTYPNAITVNGAGIGVQGSKSVNLVTVAQSFTTAAGFENGADYLSTTVNGAMTLRKSLDFNNGEAVVFKNVFKSTGVLGLFSPDGNVKGDQSNYRVRYDNNINASKTGSVAKLTVYAEGGDYAGCSKDFYFKIAPSTVVLSATDANNTVTTSLTKDMPGVTVKDEYTDASQYASTIGLKISGTNGQTGDNKIVSNATANDYDVEYSFVKKTDPSLEGGNDTNSLVKIVAKLKKDGNFSGTVTAAEVTLANGIKGTIAAGADSNGTITLFVPILDKAIEGVEVSIDKDSFVYTGKTINPKVTVKVDGKVLKADKYDVRIDNGVNVGTADITVKVDGYTGSKVLHATITPAAITDVAFAIKEAKKTDFRYNGKQQKPTIAQDNDPSTTKDESVSQSSADANVTLGDVNISKMFSITYGKNVDAGKETGTVTLTPRAAYAKNFNGDSLTANFEILPALLSVDAGDTDALFSLKDPTGKKLTIRGGSVTGNLNWTGEAVTFSSVDVDASKIDVDPTGVSFDEDNYEVAYANNIDANGSVGGVNAIICLVGKGNFAGELSLVATKYDGIIFDITSVPTQGLEAFIESLPSGVTAEVLLNSVVADSIINYNIEGSTFTSKDVTVKNGTYAGGLPVGPTVTVKDPETGKVLTEGTDYTIVYNGTSKRTEATTTPIEFGIVGQGQYNGIIIDNFADGKPLAYIIEKKDLKDAFVTVSEKDGVLTTTVMNGNIIETKETFEVKDNGDKTATVSAPETSKNYTGSATVKINAEGDVGQAMIQEVKVVNNKATIILTGDVDNAKGYDYVVSKANDYKNNRVAINKNQVATQSTVQYLDKGVYYAYLHAWKRDENGKKVFGEWSNIVQFTVTTTTPAQPLVIKTAAKGSTVTVTYTQSKDATGYDIVLGSKTKKVNGELRPVAYGKLVKKIKKGNIVTAIFKNVPKGTYYAGLHAYNRTSVNNTKVFSPWSNSKKVVVK